MVREPENNVNQEVEHDAVIWWKKTGGGSFRLNNHIIKPGERFKARPSDIPKGMRDVVLPLGKVVEAPSPETAPPPPGAKPIYTAQSSEKRVIKQHKQSRLLWNVFEGEKQINDKPMAKADAEEIIGFDILNPDGKVMNENPLTKEKADSILKSLNS